MAKLDIQHKHILKLIDRDSGIDGWTEVSEKLYNILSSNMPTELATFEKLETGGRSRLTEEGASVLNAMKWLD
jgi:hypothetical protein